MIRETKFQKSRLVPLDPTTMVGLKRYLDRRGTVQDDHVFVSLRGRGMRPSGVVTVFLRIVRAMGIHPGPGQPGPRVHDLRHGFAVRVLESCAGDRTVVDANMLALMTYMGHSQIDSTYWYLHATPHVLGQISDLSGDTLQRRPIVTPLAPYITAFLRERLPIDRRASEHTCDTYAHAFRLLFQYAASRLGKNPSQLDLEP